MSSWPIRLPSFRGQNHSNCNDPYCSDPDRNWELRIHGGQGENRSIIPAQKNGDVDSIGRVLRKSSTNLLFLIFGNQRAPNRPVL